MISSDKNTGWSLINRTQAVLNCGVMVRIYTTEIERLYDSTFDFLEIRKNSVIFIKLFESQAIFYVRLFGTITLDENSQNYPAHITL